jgi:hypothetical protein
MVIFGDEQRREPNHFVSARRRARVYSNTSKKGTMLFDTCSNYTWYEGGEKRMRKPYGRSHGL